MDMCLDCQEKVISFYHFKRKINEAHKQSVNQIGRQNVKQQNKQSKAIQNIVKIVENYAEKCSISSIRVDESHQKLVIETSAAGELITGSACMPTVPQSSWSSQDTSSHFIKQEPEEEIPERLFEATDEDLVVSDVIKEEPEEQQTIFIYDLSSFEPYTSRAQNTTPGYQRTRRNQQRQTEGTDEVSKGALRMRAYRERLKKPENKFRYLIHLEQQRQWNRKHYIKKQITSSQPIRARIRRTAQI